MIISPSGHATILLCALHICSPPSCAHRGRSAAVLHQARTTNAAISKYAPTYVPEGLHNVLAHCQGRACPAAACAHEEQRLPGTSALLVLTHDLESMTRDTTSEQTNPTEGSLGL